MRLGCCCCCKRSYKSSSNHIRASLKAHTAIERSYSTHSTQHSYTKNVCVFIRTKSSENGESVFVYGCRRHRCPWLLFVDTLYVADLPGPSPTRPAGRFVGGRALDYSVLMIWNHRLATCDAPFVAWARFHSSLRVLLAYVYYMLGSLFINQSLSCRLVISRSSFLCITQRRSWSKDSGCTDPHPLTVFYSAWLNLFLKIASHRKHKSGERHLIHIWTGWGAWGEWASWASQWVSDEGGPGQKRTWNVKHCSSITEFWMSENHIAIHA